MYHWRNKIKYNKISPTHIYSDGSSTFLRQDTQVLQYPWHYRFLMHPMWISCCSQILFCPSPGSGHGRQIVPFFLQVLKGEKYTNKPLLICWSFVFFKGKRVIISQFQGKEMLKSKSLCSVSLFLTNPPFCCYCSVLNKFLILRHIHKFAEPTNKPSHPQDWTLITFWIDLQIPVIKNHS